MPVEVSAVKKWRPLFQMLENLFLSLVFGVLMLLFAEHVLKLRGTWAYVGRAAAFFATLLLSRSIATYHRKKNVQV